MKHLYACLALIGLATGARAQTIYRPLLRPGVVYQFSESGTAGDTTHTVRLNYAGPMTWPDSLGRFNGRAVRVRTRPSTCTYLTHVIRPDGLFGATVTIGFNRHEYLLRAANGRTLLLKTQAPLNQQWTATAAGLTASTTARGVGTVLGVTDSITTITFSDGQTLRLSKQFGFVEGPALGSYLNGQRPRRLTLTALSVAGRWTGQPAVGPAAMYDFQPGDVFLRYSKQEGTQTGSLCSESWTRDSVLTRTLSGSGDTVRYTIWRRTLKRNYGSPSAPNGFCQNTPGTTLSPGYLYSQVATANDGSRLAQLTHTLAGTTSIYQSLTLAGVRTAAYNGRKVQTTLMRQVCQPSADSTLLGEILDNGGSASYAAGLGELRTDVGGIYYNNVTTLLGYRKVNLPTGSGTETWGSLRTFANILKAADVRPAASTAIFPNPFAAELTVRFEAQRAQAVTVLLRNSLGQVVHRQTRPVGAGPQQLALAVPTLAAGLYTVQLTVDGRSQVLKAIKQQ
ncbi:T9SS type A sorting domain-containing protein [Hymenobacter jeollabukensis]|uniref:T9SS type A sorting domain-containing protein n=1 Tax=Hymenobacter jeollabukensis TaxID=2025313 RepID=A0A5R8WRY5_9BACT|nr:T9SS type A sorting domain-containing protein [Hymenobacter jeollabukensis]TLM93935.1 T9SS type A sorting domain-containing protein [Hymenobacter jeollabukensis]